MKRRSFLFSSLKGALLLSPLLISRRHAEAAGEPAKRAFFWVNAGGYPQADDFFPTGSVRDFQLSPILAGLDGIKNDIVVVDGIDISDSGPNPKGNNHVRTMGKILTAKDVLTVSDKQNGDAGGPSIDHLLVDDLSLSSLEVMVHSAERNHMRSRPFASGPRAFKAPIVSPAQAWDKVFSGFEPGAATDPAAEEARRNRLLARRSVLDNLTGELGRLRQELSGFEKVKLDIHEDAIRRAELAVTRDLEGEMEATAACIPPERRDPGTVVPDRARAHMDLMFAAFLCNRVQVGGMVWGYSGYHWRYEWVSGVETDDIHDSVHHRASAERDTYVRACRWDWDQFAGFVQRLKDTPEGAGTMLDQTVVLGTSNFGKHHQMRRIPIVLAGNANGQLETGRYIKLDNTVHNDKPLTSIAHLMGDQITGIGDDQNCGPLPELHG